MNVNTMKSKLEAFFCNKETYTTTYINGAHNSVGQEVVEVTIENRIGSLKIRIADTTSDFGQKRYVATFKPTDSESTADVFFGLTTRQRDTIRFKVDDHQAFLEDWFFGKEEINHSMYGTISDILWGVGHCGDGWDIFNGDVPEELTIKEV